MKKTINAELRAGFIRQILINDNALLYYRHNEKNNELVDISLRYIEHNKIHEQHLITLPKERLIDGLIEINSKGTAIATYKEVEEGYQLDRVYSIEEHTFGVSDFLDLEYKKYFPENALSKEMIKKRGTKDGKH